MKYLLIRLLIYIAIFVLLRIIYLFMAFELGFGSASNHLMTDVTLNIVLIAIIIFIMYWLFAVTSTLIKRTEKPTVLVLTLAVWILSFYYFNFSL
jgi:divalent metal cation (Fe/Co/Zn/Cd) transporter